MTSWLRCFGIALAFLVLASILPSTVGAQTPIYLTQWGSFGSGDGQFMNPTGVATDSAGNVYVADINNHRIQKFSGTGTYLTQWGSPGNGDGQFNSPVGVATDVAGNVYVADLDNRRIQKFTGVGAYLTQWGSPPDSSNRLFIAPYAVATDAAGGVYVTDFGNNSVMKFTDTGTYLTQWGSFGSGNGQFQNPQGVATDSAGNVYVADYNNQRIQKFTGTGIYLAKWGSFGSGNGQFAFPIGVATDAAGNVIVAELSNNRIQAFSSTGTFLTKWGSLGNGNGQFSTPRGVATDAAGNIYVADQGNHRIQKFGPAAAPLANDNFSNASGINLNALPFSATVTITEATTESGEPQACSFSQQTIWYKLTPTTGVWLRANTLGSSLFGANLSVYRDSGSGITGLNFVGCSDVSGSVTFLAQAGTTYYLQAAAPCCGVSGDVRVNLEQTAAPVPVASFYFSPGDPSIFDTLQFFDQSFDPGQQGIQSQAWNFGDGSTATGSSPTHRFAADGNYTVRLAVTTFDGRTAGTSQVASVRTHDVAITKFKVPQSASAGQTRQITVGIRNTRYPENVRVQLEKSGPGGFGSFEFVGFLNQLVPVRPSNRTTDFNFSYTFTSDDARIGKVAFRAVATLFSVRDASSADNEAISLPVKVSGSGAVPVASGGAPVVSGDDEVISGDDGVVSGESRVTVPAARLALLGVAPNPAYAGVDLLVRLSAPPDGAATLQVLDIAGRVMAKRDLGLLGPGIHEASVAWGRRPAPGIYWVCLSQRDKSVSMRVAILR
jgi:PKD domain-containing protein/NHL repeat-containing protein